MYCDGGGSGGGGSGGDGSGGGGGGGCLPTMSATMLRAHALVGVTLCNLYWWCFPSTLYVLPQILATQIQIVT